MSSVPVHIKAASLNDCDALLEISLTTFMDSWSRYNRKEDMDKYAADELNRGKLIADLQQPGNIFFLAHSNGAAIAYAKMRCATESGVEAANPVEIERFYVREQYQNLKVGALLMEHCISHAVACRHDVLWLGVWERNFSAIRFYERFGFQLFGSHPFLLGNDLQTDLLMKKLL